MVAGKHRTVRVEEGPLRTYLQGHLAMSHAGEGIATGLRDRTDDPSIRAFLSSFVQEVVEERAVLEDLLDEVADEGLIRRGLDIAAEVVGKAGRLAQADSPGPFAELEALALGVWGKRLLWGTLRRLAQVDEMFRRVPVAELSDRAERQELDLLRLRDEAIIPALAPQLAARREPE